MFNRILRPILCAFALLLPVVPAHAAQPIDLSELPVQGPYVTERSWEAFTMNGRTAGLVRSEYIYGEKPEDLRVPYVWHDLDAGGAIVAVFEYIVIGGVENGVLYERRNAEQRWNAARLGEPGGPSPRDFELCFSKTPPAEWPQDFRYVYVGETDVNGVRSRHYQGMMKPEKMTSDVTLVKADNFFANQPVNGVENYFNKNQTTLGLKNANGGTDLLEYVVVAYDPNVPLRIGTPPEELVDSGGAQALTGLSSRSQALRARIRTLAVR